MRLKSLLFGAFGLLLTPLQAQNDEPFGAEIRAFEQKDSVEKPLKGQIVLYGSSTLRLWKTAERDFATKNLKVVNRGFGGSKANEAIRYFERVVVPHQPKWLFFYEGDNDLASGQSVDSVMNNLKTFVKMTQKRLPNTRLVIFAVKPSPSRTQWLDKQKALNRRLWQLAQRERNVFFLDTASILLDATGQPAPQYFIGDMLHMNELGYALWTKKVQWFLKKCN